MIAPASLSPLSRRRLLLGAGTAALAGCAPLRPAAAPRLRLIGTTTLAHRLAFRGTTVGGLSGLDYDPVADLWYALSDDRSDINPARFYTLRLRITPDSLAAPQLLEVTTLRQPSGLPYPSRRQGGDVPDPEAIRYVARTQTLVWSSEGDAKLDLDPFVREMRLDGRHVREFGALPMFRFDASQASGPRDNLSFEGIALTPGGTGAWVSMEAPLYQDGPAPAVGLPGGPCRFTLWDMASGRALRQFAYLPDAIPQATVPPGAYADNGISEILMLDADRMLVLERSYMTGVGNSLRLYLVDTREGSDTLDQPVLRAGAYRSAAKTLVADFATLGLPRLDNTEGMAWGPKLPSGRRTLVFVSDDNFNPAQITQFAAFEFME